MFADRGVWREAGGIGRNKALGEESQPGGEGSGV